MSDAHLRQSLRKYDSWTARQEMCLERRIRGGNLFIFSSFALLYFTLLQFNGIM